MLTRDKVLGMAADDCMRELYTLVQPKVDWADFIKENEVYSGKFKVWERFNYLYHKEDKTEKELEEYSKLPVKKWEGKSITECIGPKPYEFYYLPKDVLKDIADSYVFAYKLDEQQKLLNIIELLKEYCQAPIIEKYIKGKYGSYRGYEYPDNLEKEIQRLIQEYDSSDVSKEISEKCYDKFFEFLDMAGKFYNWTSELNAFNMSIYLGASPSSNKEAVIENWKKYRNKDIIIDEILIRQNCYGDE